MFIIFGGRCLKIKVGYIFRVIWIWNLDTKGDVVAWSGHVTAFFNFGTPSTPER